MKFFNPDQRRLGLALLASALVNISILATLGASFQRSAAEDRSRAVHPNLSVAFLPAGEADTAEREISEDLIRTDPVDELFQENPPAPSSGLKSPSPREPGKAEREHTKPDTPDKETRPGERVPLSAEAGRNAASGETASGEEGPSRDEFLIMLQELIGENLDYPRRARQRGIEGTVVVELSIDSEGMLRSRRIMVQSGSSMLDRAALSLLDTLFPVAVKPGYQLDCSVSVSYQLN